MINENLYTQLSVKLGYSRDEIREVVHSQFSLLGEQLNDEGEDIRFMYIGAFKRKSPNIHEYVKEIKSLPPKERAEYKKKMRDKYIKKYEERKIKD